MDEYKEHTISGLGSRGSEGQEEITINGLLQTSLNT